MSWLVDSAVWMEMLGNSDAVLGIATRLAFIACALIALWQLLAEVVSTPTQDERGWDRRPRRSRKTR